MITKKINISPTYIKNYIEELTEMDLTSSSRVRSIVEMRWVAFKLTRVLTRTSLYKIGELYNKNHATVLYGIKNFDFMYNMEEFNQTKTIYKRVYNAFLEIQSYIGIDGKIETLKELNENFQNQIGSNNETLEFIKFKYENKIDQITEKYNKSVRDLTIKNQRFTTNPIFEKITNLPEQEFQDLEIRVNAFLQMNAMNGERQKKRNAV